jgi:hypothetical protein
MRDNLCRRFCAYFKPSTKEELECQGLLVVERLMKNGKAINFFVTDRAYDYSMQEMLIQNMCTVCPFYQNDCDFILSKQSPVLNRQGTKRPPPCGGFIILTHLVERNIITIDDIRDIL